MKMHVKSSRFFQLSTALAVLSAGLIAGQANAGPTDNLPAVTVSYADLNLANPAGVRILHRRIETAARSVCGNDFDSQVLELRDAARECYKAALKKAVAQLRIREKYAQK